MAACNCPTVRRDAGEQIESTKEQEAYESIGGGSPLRRITDEQSEALKKSLVSERVSECEGVRVVDGVETFWRRRLRTSRETESRAW